MHAPLFPMYGYRTQPDFNGSQHDHQWLRAHSIGESDNGVVRHEADLPDVHVIHPRWERKAEASIRIAEASDTRFE
jgi:hypothetical protein